MRAFSGEGLCKALAFMEIWFLLTWVSVHENVHQLKKQVRELVIFLSPHHPTVQTLLREGALWKTVSTLHF